MHQVWPVHGDARGPEGAHGARPAAARRAVQAHLQSRTGAASFLLQCRHLVGAEVATSSRDVSVLPETWQRLQESEGYVYLSDADAEEEEEDEGILERAAELKAKITALGGASPSAGVLTELLRVRPKAVVKLNMTDRIERSSARHGRGMPPYRMHSSTVLHGSRCFIP